MSRKQSRRNLASNVGKTPRSQKVGMKNVEAPPPNEKKKGTCALAGTLEAVNGLIEKHFKAIGEIAVKHCERANSDPQRSKELNPDDVVRDACDKLRLNWAKVPDEPRFIRYVKSLITACPLAGSLEAVENLIATHEKEITAIVAKHCPPAYFEFSHVSEFKPDDVKREISKKLKEKWEKVPIEPGFFKFVKTLVRHHMADLWKKYETRVNAVTRYGKATPNKRSQDGHYHVDLRETRDLLDAACLLLRTKMPLMWRAFELRRIKGLQRKTVAEMMGIKRLSTISEYVEVARVFLIAVLPPRYELV